MESDSLEYKYIAMYDSLRGIILTSQERVIDENPDELFLNNINFFVKAYLINIYTYLESFLQEIALQYGKKINDKITAAKIPQNYVHWRLATKKHKDADYTFMPLDLPVDSKIISSDLSANIFKTIDLFRNFGIDLTKDRDFQKNKGVVNTVVTKRNNIIHHNDNASDVTFPDLLAHIDIFVEYMKAINRSVSSH